MPLTNRLDAFVGVNIGALSVKVVSLCGDEIHSRMINHQGYPLKVLQRILAEKEFRGDFVGVSGHLGHISEVAAIQRALEDLEIDFDAVASLGGESFLVYSVEDKQILKVLSHNKCAAGSGEFFVQQIGRMGLGIDEAIQRSFRGKVVPLASRCSVHCKSDITHKLNRQEVSPEDILHTLHDSMANKVICLLDKGHHTLERLLLIGGVARNKAMVAALREKLPKTEVVVLPESPYFEALGTALLTRDEPLYRSPNTSVKPTLESLPPLQLHSNQVHVIPAAPDEKQVTGPLVLGIDAGSTTTKAVLLDPVTRRVVASHYGRTQGDPVGATRRCLRALIKKVGDLKVRLVATTGSAREVSGAYLGTEHVYNEISSHAAGAAHFDPEVDTIFEIGGQDSKYIHLRHGIPIDYAMNAACSAGTGSFMEESAKGDLGIPLAEIADVALSARSPVQFKATCAAFINSDIRIALQKGYSREDIVAGLVYSIANNYLTRVKGLRHVGKRVFLQGGVALNKAVGNAFAHSVGRDIVIPPSPELLGAQGVALLALKRSKGSFAQPTHLSTLAEPKMRLLNRFTCKACKMFCTIDRFEVGGRRFPFGGRCSLFENVWKRRSRFHPAPDLVEQRSHLLFGRAVQNGDVRRLRLGIPKALTSHSLFPLFSNFFSGLGMEVILSGVDPRGELKSHSGFCFPAQIAHGAVLDLSRQDVNLIFFPHVSRMPNPMHSKDSYLCPITQAGPYVLAKAFPNLRFLSPLLDFSEGYASSTALVDMAIKELGARREVAEEAFQAAVTAQLEVEQSLRDLGEQALKEAVEKGKPTILLVGRSYNAFTPEASQSVGKKLSSMGFTVIPADCLASVQGGASSWHFPNMIMNTVATAKRYPNLFLLYVSNFSCTIDSFTHSLLASEMGSKPYLMLEIDAHTADAGIQTRLEAFLDIIENYRETREKPLRSFTPARLGQGGLVTTSSGEQVPLSDPRVKLYFPAFSEFHSQAWMMAARWLGFHPGGTLHLEHAQLERGLQYTSGRECLPLPICLGQLLQIHERQKPGEIAGFYMLRGGAPCVVDVFLSYFERFIAQQELPDLLVLSPHEENDYCGIGIERLAEHLSPAVVVADILVEIKQTLRVVGIESSMEELKRHWERFARSATSLSAFHESLPWLIERLSEIPRSKDPATCPRVVVTGDFFTRFSDSFMEGVPEIYAKRGIILKPVDLNELVLYSLYDAIAGSAHDWGLKPGYEAMAKACTRILHPDGQNYLNRWMSYRTWKKSEERYRKQFQKTGLLVAGANDVSFLFEKAAQHVSPAIFGELIPTLGRGLEAENEGYEGIILIGPFNCLPFRISEAILKPLSYQGGLPILTYESDSYAVPPSFLRQVDVHIEQVLRRWKSRDHSSSQKGLSAEIGEQIRRIVHSAN
jgi:predicted CoA-substrate-specific enzyme activase